MKMKPRAHRTVEDVLCWPTIPRPAWSLVDISNFMSLEKSWFPLFPSRSKLQKLIREVWDFVSASSRYCIFISLNLCRSWVWCHSLSEFMWVSAMFFPRGHCFLGAIHHLQLLQLFCLLFFVDPRTLRQEICIPFKTECSKISLTVGRLSSCGSLNHCF